MTTPAADQLLAQQLGEVWDTTFRQAEASVCLRTNSKAAFTHATGTLYAYEQTGPATSRWQIDLLVDGGPAYEEVEGFADAQTVEIGPRLMAAVHTRPGRQAYWVEALHTLIAIDTKQATVTVRCAQETAALHWAARLPRQAITAQLLENGAVYAHTAALSLGGRGVVIAGHRGRGKTTTLLASLHRLGADYVTNDRLLLRADSDLVGHVWPARLRAGIGTLSVLPHLADLVPQAQRVVPDAERWTSRPKVAVEPWDFARLVSGEAQVLGSLRPSMLVFPQLDPTAAAVRVEPVARARVREELLHTRLFMTDPGRGPSSHINHWLWPTPDPQTMDRNLARVVDALAELPCYRIHAGGEPAALADAVGGLLELGPGVNR
ncbi:hypothetical protein OG800_50085 (plasmid) [Streptomyces sp. NBC_00445]|uniref:hypothetical protein n=1 Tax=Streptomyces sp. NBC_00445 TaxID=2975745 RepID=UPI002E23C367